MCFKQNFLFKYFDYIINNLYYKNLNYIIEYFVYFNKKILQNCNKYFLNLLQFFKK